MLELNSNAGCVIGLDLRMTNILMIVTDMQGKILRKSVIPYDARPGIGNYSSSPDKLSEQIIAIIEQERGVLPHTPLGLVGAGIGVHGFVEYPSGRIVFMPHTGWKGLSWKEELEARLGLPVILDNEANLAALGELNFGAGVDSGIGDMLYLSISGGIGAGFISGGELFRGSGGLAGEVGHTTIEANGLPCSCGNRGCWERYASERAVADKLALEYAPGITERLVHRLKEKDPEVLSAIRDAGEYLGIGIGNMMHTLNPQLIVVGNAMSEYNSWMNDVVQEVLESRFSYVRSFQAKVRFSRLGEDSCALGAASSIIRMAMQKR